MERAGGLLAAAPVGGDAEVQGDEGGCEPDRDQQAAETDPGASATSQGDHQAADYRDHQADFCDSPRRRVVEGRREHGGGSSPSATLTARSTTTGKWRRHRLEPTQGGGFVAVAFWRKGDSRARVVTTFQRFVGSGSERDS